MTLVRDETTYTNKTIIAGVLAVTAAFFIGLVVGVRNPYDIPLISSAVAPAGIPPGIDLAPVWQTWKIIDDKFVPASVSSTTKPKTQQDRVWGMAAGVAASLGDPYTVFFPPVESQAFAEDIKGAFEGVGMEIETKDGVLTVVSPLKGSPSFKAGMKSGDRILTIDGLTTKDMPVSEAVKHIRGAKGTSVKLKVLREGAPAFDITIMRDVINIPTVDTKRLPDGTFVITLLSFNAQSADLFRAALREFFTSGDGNRLILDLRGNPGGYLESAVSAGSWFLPAGKVIVTEDYAGKQPSVSHRSLGYNVFAGKGLHMVILVDKGSASASEILAGALQKHGVAKLVGTNTFGKGSVQELIPITADTSLKVTVARWLDPDGIHIPPEGIKPDIAVTISEADIKAGKDPQMDRAVQIVNQ